MKTSPESLPTSLPICLKSLNNLFQLVRFYYIMHSLPIVVKIVKISHYRFFHFASSSSIGWFGRVLPWPGFPRPVCQSVRGGIRHISNLDSPTNRVPAFVGLVGWHDIHPPTIAIIFISRPAGGPPIGITSTLSTRRDLLIRLPRR